MAQVTTNTKVKLSQEMVEKLNKLLNRKGGEVDDLLTQVVKAGIYQVDYRLGEKTRRAAKRMVRETNDAIAERVRRDPEMAVKCGLAHVEAQ